MRHEDDLSDDGAGARAVPGGRAARIGHFGALAGEVAGGMLAEGARRLFAGERPRLRDLMLTRANVSRVADRLSHLRGAAMKLGQMISLDAGDMLEPELAAILARLRENAHRMPPGQLQQVLAGQWGKDWRTRFVRFDPRPIAAASIGQVHRARTRDGRDLAIKVQYPGVREGIDADVDNVATLLRVSRLVPDDLDIGPLLEIAKEQLAEEADYLREAEHLSTYARLLEGEEAYLVPGLHRDLTTSSILAMDFVEASGIETLAEAPPDLRNEAMARLIDLVLRELFEFGVMQTDPNFANYRIEKASNRLVLLDFGAARPVPPRIARNYGAMLRAGLAQDRAAIREAAVAAGFMSQALVERQRAEVDKIIDLIATELGREGPFDFADRRFVAPVREEGLKIARDRANWHLPPGEVLFVQRKISGTALLAARLRARIDVRALVARRLPAADSA